MVREHGVDQSTRRIGLATLMWGSTEDEHQLLRAIFLRSLAVSGAVVACTVVLTGLADLMIGRFSLHGTAFGGLILLGAGALFPWGKSEPRDQKERHPEERIIAFKARQIALLSAGPAGLTALIDSGLTFLSVYGIGAAISSIIALISVPLLRRRWLGSLEASPRMLRPRMP